LKKNNHETFLAFDPQLFNDLFLNWPGIARFFDFKKNILKQLEREKPELIAFSVVSDNYPWACQMAMEIKAELGDIPIVFGGPHITAVPDRVLSKPFIDYIIAGEGEYPMLELVEALEGKRPVESIQNLGYKPNGVLTINEARPLIQDLDELPFPDTDLFLKANPYAKKEYNIIAGRGCVNSCSYCHNSVERKLLWKNRGMYFRRRSMDNVLAELKERKEKYKFDTVCFWDEVFTCDVQWLEEFCSRYKKEIAIPFWTFVHPSHISEKAVRILEDAGCWEAEMGVQTLNPWVKENILRRFESQEKVENAIRTFGKSNIRIVTDVIFGLPLLKGEDYYHLIDTFNKHLPTKVQTFWLRYYPSTDIIDLAKNNQLLTDSQIEEINDGIPSRAAASGGSFIDPKLERYQTALSLLPYLPKWFRSNLVKKNWIRFMPKISGFGHLFTRLLDVKNKNDVGARRYKGRMIHFTAKKLLPFLGKQ
jgi:radical SAM superfamily enzyme YgiQ (UPF0313 family)